MSEGTAVAQQMRPAAESRPLVEHALVQLTLVRFREFWREPEAVFWVFVFPILLATGLPPLDRSSPRRCAPKNRWPLTFWISRRANKRCAPAASFCWPRRRRGAV